MQRTVFFKTVFLEVIEFAGGDRICLEVIEFGTSHEASAENSIFWSKQKRKQSGYLHVSRQVQGTAFFVNRWCMEHIERLHEVQLRTYHVCMCV